MTHIDAGRQSATMGRLLLARADDDNIALLFEDRTWTWRQLVAEAARHSEYLERLRPSDEQPWHIGVLMENTPDYLFLVAGAMICGATIVGLNHSRRGRAIASDIAATACSTVLVDKAMSALLDDAGSNCSTVLFASVELVDRVTPQLKPDSDRPDARLLLLLTSGATGAPKAVNLSTGRWARACLFNQIRIGPEDVAYNAMALFQGGALISAWGPCIRSGAAFALRRQFSATQFLADIQTFGATFFTYLGRSLSYILAQTASAEEANNQLRFGFGTEASPRDRADFTRRYRAPLFDSFGSCEGTFYIARTSDAPEDSLGREQIGSRPEVVDPDGVTCPPAQFDTIGVLINAQEAVGEIVARGGAANFEGYYRNPAATAERIRAGDYWTGDLGYRDAQGNFYFAGRVGDWIRVDSEKFTAAPIERVMMRYEAVISVAVYGVPDTSSGEQVMAAVQLRDGFAFDPTDFADFLVSQPDLPPKWIPRYLRVCARIPLTATMKVRKGPLKAEGWCCTEPVFERIGRASFYLQMSGRRAADLLAETKFNRFSPVKHRELI
ncbi:AMP-binding protein [Nocardia sp. NPDC006630]|uniref:AMP-binding protein n=1 Tax=Nocardia sp. NPDC006630 TaxID=3157181 RepID=UPI0033BC09E2